MKTLLILRHAKSSWSDPELSDHDRPLNKRGRLAAPVMGAFLDERSGPPDLIVSSSALRAMQTASLFAVGCAYAGPIEERAELYGGGPDEYLAVLRGVSDVYGRVLVVGHNPAIEELWLGLTGRLHRWPTCALGEVRLEVASWSRAHGGAVSEAEGPWLPRAVAGERDPE